MPIPGYTGLPATLGTSVDTNSVTWTLMFRYGSFCTQFVHDGVSQNFSGKALLSGHALNVGSGGTITGTSTVSIGIAPPLTMTVLTALFTTTTGTVAPYFYAAFSNVPNPYSTYTPNHATLHGTFAAQTIQLFGTTSICGEISSEIDSNLGPLVTFGNVQIDITRGGSCPV